MQMMVQMRQEDKEKEEKREERRIREAQKKEETRRQEEREREDRRMREQNKREEWLLAQMQLNARAVPQTVTVQQSHLPKMGTEQTIDDFIGILEATFEIDNIEGDVRKKKALFMQLTLELATMVTRELRDADIMYEVITDVLSARSEHTRVAACGWKQTVLQTTKRLNKPHR